MDLTKFTITRSKWRCGEGARDSTKELGLGVTELLNKEGFMCCLGQISQQLGYKKKELLGVTEPVNFVDYEDNILVWSPENDGFYQNTRLSIEAIKINDNKETTIKEKEKLLIQLFKKNKLKLSFVD